jgi:hypothetical protein
MGYKVRCLRVFSEEGLCRGERGFEDILFKRWARQGVSGQVAVRIVERKASASRVAKWHTRKCRF